jgi:biotin-(acetyl-CoA carboxylase) ligase
MNQISNISEQIWPNLQLSDEATNTIREFTHSFRDKLFSTSPNEVEHFLRTALPDSYKKNIINLYKKYERLHAKDPEVKEPRDVVMEYIISDIIEGAGNLAHTRNDTIIKADDVIITVETYNPLSELLL